MNKTYTMSTDEVLKSLDTDGKGLSSQEAAKRLEKFVLTS